MERKNLEIRTFAQIVKANQIQNEKDIRIISERTTEAIKKSLDILGLANVLWRLNTGKIKSKDELLIELTKVVPNESDTDTE